MIRRFIYGALLVGSLAGIYLLDAYVLPRPVLIRVLLLVMTLGALREVIWLAGRKVETAPARSRRW
jgi:hypothetical protein